MYIFFYLLVISCFLLYMIIFLPLYYYSQLSFSLLFSFINIYTNSLWIFFILFFILSGLPPVGFFFLKLNIIIYIINYNISYFIIILFNIFFFNMLFYLSIFKYHKNWVFLSNLFKKKIYFTVNKSVFLKKNPILSKFFYIEYEKSKLSYNILYILLLLIFFLFFTSIFFIDLFLIFYNFFL